MLDFAIVGSFTVPSHHHFPMELSMIVFNVNDMTCGHCVGAVTKAVKAVDPDATVSVNLGTKRVEIDADDASAHELKAAIADAGYTPVEAGDAAKSAAAPGGGCCGTCH
ncbi:MAG TPA: heavy-metal-associated domain-containing protein [Rhizobacter sp.]